MPTVRIEKDVTVSWRMEVDGQEYTRYSAGVWYRWYGESLEPEFSRETELEKLFVENGGEHVS